MEFPKDLSTHEIELLEHTAAFVKNHLKQAESGHDWWHILRVWNNAMHIAEKKNCNKFLVGLGVLLHDIADPKFHNGNTEIGPKTTESFLRKLDISEDVIEKTVAIVQFSSFSAEQKGMKQPRFIEFQIVQDADRLDAIGAIGIARTFNYGGYKNNPLYLPETPDNQENNSTIQHFYDKLFLLKDLMNTPEAKAIAEERHNYMQGFVDRFMWEWNGNK